MRENKVREKLVGKTVRDIRYNNAINYFGV